LVLGLVSTKEAIGAGGGFKAADHRGSRFVALERLGLSPQCGFASSVIGNKISPEIQQQKLELVVKTAQAVWG
jgi:5-methyltetrahydropteroyltriglutamate--homocysteine methyltransferase